jgi:hypothetical protein
MKTLTELEVNTAYELVNFTIEKLNNIAENRVHGCDLHNEIFNTDYFIIGRYQSEQWLINNVGIFNAIEIIKEYEQDNFGTVSTDLSEPEKVVNMFVYIVGELILQESNHLNNCWDDYLSVGDIETVKTELEYLLNN